MTSSTALLIFVCKELFAIGAPIVLEIVDSELALGQLDQLRSFFVVLNYYKSPRKRLNSPLVNFE